METMPFFIDRTFSSLNFIPVPKTPNKSILVIAGVHGNEHNAVLATKKLMNAIETSPDFSKSGATVRFIIGANRYGLLNNTREWGEPDCIKNDAGEPVDLNRVFKEDKCPPGSTLLEIKNKLSKAIFSADIVIDVHNSPAMEPCVLLNNDTHTREYVKFCTANEIRYITQESTNSTVKKYAIDTGKIGFTVELGGMTLSPWHDKIIADQYMFLTNFLSALYMSDPAELDSLRIDSKPLIPSEIMYALPARCYGMVEYVENALSDKFFAGDVIAHIISENGLIGDDVIAPCDGWIGCCNPTLFVRPGDEYVYWQPKVNV